MGSNLNERRKSMNKALADELEFWHFDDDLMVYSDGSLGGGFELSGRDISCVGADVINDYNARLEDLLTSCEDGLRLQVFYNLSSDLKSLADLHEETSREAPVSYHSVARARKKFFNKGLDAKLYYQPKIYLFVRSSPLAQKKQKLFDSDKAFKKISKAEYEKHKEKFYRSFNQIKSSLGSCGMEVVTLKKAEWFHLCFDYLNLERSERLGRPDLKSEEDLFAESLSSQLCLTDLKVNKDGVQFGDYVFRSITLKTLPEAQTQAAMIERLTALPFHFWITQNVHILSQSQEKSRLELKRRVAHSMAAGSKNVSDLESESKLSHIESLLEELLEGSVKLLSQDFTVTVWDVDKKQLDEKCDEVLKAFRALNQAEGLIESVPAKEAFFAAMPGVCSGMRHKKMKSSNIAHLMPLYSYWRGNERPVCLIPNRDNGLFSLDPFSSSLPNWNGVVFGGSGSGKSFTIAQLMLQFYGQTPRPRIIWIDNGASSKRLLEVLDGEFLDFKLDSGLCINMFDLKKGEQRPGPEKIKLILAILELILKDEDKQGLPKRHKALLEEAIYRIYEKFQNTTPTLSDFRADLRDHEVKEMRDFSEVLYSWSGSTAYGNLLDGQTNVVLSKDLVTIEVQNLNSHSDLKDVILLLLTSYIQETSSQDFETPYLLVVDEAERLFQTEMARQFVITCYRTWRKFNSAIWCLSQNYKDFMQDKNLRDSLMPNTNHLIILRQRKIDWRDFQTTFDFTDAQVSVIKSLEIVKGRYSEFFYLQDENQTVLRLVPEPLSYWICTSDGNDKAEIRKMQESFPELSLTEVLERLAFPDEYEHLAA